MFSGIVEESAVVSDIQRGPRFLESSLEGTPSTNAQKAVLTVHSQLDHHDTNIGDSICMDGVCLTVTSKIADPVKGWHLTFDLSSETLRCTTFELLNQGDTVHLERSLQMGARIHGHLVTGHVDGTALLIARETEGETLRLQFQLAAASPYLAPKGSISLAGVSLTVGACQDDVFCVYVIPHTDEVTRLGKIVVGSRVNVEYDIFARYLERFMVFQVKTPSSERLL